MGEGIYPLLPLLILEGLYSVPVHLLRLAGLYPVIPLLRPEGVQLSPLLM